MSDPVVLVLGCGIGGVAAARELRRLLPARHRVIVIDREANASYPPSYLWVVTGERRPETIRRQRAHLAGKGIEFVHANIHQIDLEAKYVRAEGREFYYDYLIIALGAETTMERLPVLAEVAHSFHTLDGAERLAASLRYFAGGNVIIAAMGENYRSLPSPYEAAMLLEHHFLGRRMRQKVDIQVYTPEPEPLAISGDENSQAIAGLLAHKGIGFNGGVQLAEVDSARREAYFTDGSQAPFQLLIVLPDHQAPALVRDAGLAGDSGWIEVDSQSMETTVSGVFAIGDVITYPMPDGRSLPKAGVYAEKQGQVAARNIAFRMVGGPRPDPFDGNARWLLEVGAGASLMLEGNLLQSSPQIEMKQPSLIWHWAKLASERYWLWHTY